MAIVNRIALDLAKDFIQVLALDDNEQEVFNKKLRSNKVLAKLATLKRTDDCEVAVESCGMSHYCRRECERWVIKRWRCHHASSKRICRVRRTMRMTPGR